MNEFKFKQKEVVKDEDLLKYKNFNEVLNKHDQISKGYKSVVKIWGSIGLAALIGAIALFNFNKPTSIHEDVVETAKPYATTPVHTVSYQPKKESATATLPLQEEKKLIDEDKVEEKDEKELKTIQHTAPLKVVPEEKVKERKEESVTDTVIQAVKPKVNIEEKYHLKSKTIEERINLPTLYIGGQAWPSMVKKSDLVKKSNPTAFYREINQEVPVISYVMSKVDVNHPELKSKKIHNQDGRFSAAILREVHRSNPGDFLIYKNITVYIPGIGRMNLGDLKVEIVDDKLYQKRLREKKPVTE